MGYETRRVGVVVTCSVSRHNSERDKTDDALTDDLARRIREAVAPIVTDPRYAGLISWAEDLTG